MNKLWLLLASLLACGESRTCPLVAYPDGFTIVITDDAWERQDYRLIVSYEDRGRALAYVCDVRVPAYAFDGGVAIVASSDAGVVLRDMQSCRAVQGEEVGSATVRLGRALEASFPGVPTTVKLELSTPSGPVLSQELSLRYRTEHPDGDGCGGPTTATVHVPLP